MFKLLIILSALFSGLIACTDAIPEVKVLNPRSLGIIGFNGEEVVINNQIYLKNPIVDVTSQFFGPVTEIAISEGSLCAPAETATWLDLKTTVTFNLSAGDGPKILSFRYRNSFMMFDCQNITVVLDTTAPVFASLTPPTIVVSQDSANTPTLTWSEATDSGSGVRNYELSLVLYSPGGIATQIVDWTDFKKGLSGGLTGLNLDDGSYELRLQAVDNLLQVSEIQYLFFDKITVPVPSLALIPNVLIGSAIPTITVSSANGFVSGDQIYLYNDINCTAFHQEANVSATTSSIDVVPLLQIDATFIFYANTLRNGLYSACSSGISYTLDTLAPGISLSDPRPSIGNSSSAFVWTVDYTGADFVTLKASDISFLGQDTTGCVANVSNVSITAATVTVTGCTAADSNLGIQIANGSAIDLAGNLAASISSNASSAMAFATVDNVAPTVTIGSVNLSFGNFNSDFIWPVTYVGATDIPLLASDIILNDPNLGCTVFIADSPSNFSIKNIVVACTGNGHLSVSIKAGTALDSAGNSAPSASGSDSALINNISPTITIGNPSPSFGSSTTAFVWPVTYMNAASITLVPANITLVGETAGCSLVVGEGLTANVQNIIVTNCTGSGTLTFSIANGSATDSSGNQFPASGVSVAVTLDQQIYTIQFTKPLGAILGGNPSNSQTISLTIDPAPLRDVTVNFNVNSAATTAAPADYSFTSIQSVTFSANNPTTTIDYTYNVNPSPEISKILQLDIASIDGQVNSRLGPNLKAQRLIKSATFDGFTNIAVGESHTCGVTNSGAMKCWGDNRFGQLGSGPTAPGAVPQSNTPLGIDLATKYSQVTAGGSHTCGLAFANINTPGKLSCWGDNTYGQLGSGQNAAGTAPQSNTPVKVDQGTDFQQIAAGTLHTCGLTSSGALKCWGNNSKGQLGISPASGSTNPIIFIPTVIDDALTSYLQVTAGASHTCGITSAKVLKCWGDNSMGQLNNGQPIQSYAPLVIDSGTLYQNVSAGAFHTCGITTGGVLKCWGNNSSGQLGSGDLLPPATPLVIVDLGTPYQNVSAGASHTCGITTGEVLKCWGDNFPGRLGNRLPTPSYTPLVIDSANLYAQISAGSTHSCGITLTGELKCWGRNSTGELGNGLSETSHTPSVIDSTTGYQQVSAGTFHTCGINSTGSLKCWGDNNSNQLGNGQSIQSYSPLVIDSETNYRQVSAGALHTCGITLTGVLKCWGKNIPGPLDNGLFTNSSTPVVIDSLASYLQISAGLSHTCGITSRSDLKCWGVNTYGELGDGSQPAIPESAKPLLIDSGIIYSQVAVGNSHSCGITVANVNTDPILKCWGDNSKGQLGDGPPIATPKSATPLAIDPGIIYSQVALGAYHTCAITYAGVLKCWGDNSSGQLGYGPPTATLQSNTPLTIDSPITYLKVAAGPRHTCAITSAGALKCWGNNSSGQLGYVSPSGITQSNTPTDVDPGILYKDISTGSGHTCGVVTLDNKLKCWGHDFYGQLGRGLWTNLPGLVIQ